MDDCSILVESWVAEAELVELTVFRRLLYGGIGSCTVDGMTTYR